MRGRLQGVVQASGATIVLEHGSEASVLGRLGHRGTLGRLGQVRGRPLRP